MTVFAQLLGSGLPITWTVVRLAWRTPTGLHVSIPQITHEELLAYAMDRIGYGPPEQETLVAELAFTDETDTWTIQRLLEELAPHNPVELQNALRVWRWMLLNEIVTEAERQAQDAPDEYAPIYGIWTDDFRTSVYCSFRDLWEEFEFPLRGFDVAPGWQNAEWFIDIPRTLRFIALHRQWLVQEAIELRNMGDAA